MIIVGVLLSTENLESSEQVVGGRFLRADPKFSITFSQENPVYCTVAVVTHSCLHCRLSDVKLLFFLSTFPHVHLFIIRSHGIHLLLLFCLRHFICLKLVLFSRLLHKHFTTSYIKANNSAEYINR